jgi:histidinol phosphatase-like PHP family hydrolase
MRSLIDLHCHSTVSDGVLTPTEIVNHAAEKGVRVLALTDHDDVAGLKTARAVAVSHGMPAGDRRLRGSSRRAKPPGGCGGPVPEQVWQG